MIGTEVAGRFSKVLSDHGNVFRTAMVMAMAMLYQPEDFHSLGRNPFRTRLY